MSESDFSKYRVTKLPRSVAVGHGVLDDIASICADVGLRGSALLVQDATTEKIAGGRVSDSLKKGGYTVHSFIITDADMENVKAVMEKARQVHADFLLGIGGGRSIDVAKCASSEIGGMPFISVPTAASHDGIVSGAASITVDGKKKSISAHPPMIVVADTEIIANAPYALLSAGYGDIISNKTAVLDWELANREKGEEISSYAIALSAMTGEIMLRHADQMHEGDEKSAWMVVKALTASGVAMSIAGSSRPASGAEHLFSHALDRIAEKPGLHGHQCAIGSIMMLKLHGGDWEGFRERMKIAGLPTSAGEIGLSEDEVVKALLMAPEIRPERYTVLHKLGLSREEAEELARETGVIGGE